MESAAVRDPLRCPRMAPLYHNLHEGQCPPMSGSVCVSVGILLWGPAEAPTPRGRGPNGPGPLECGALHRGHTRTGAPTGRCEPRRSVAVSPGHVVETILLPFQASRGDSAAKSAISTKIDAVPNVTAAEAGPRTLGQGAAARPRSAVGLPATRRLAVLPTA